MGGSTRERPSRLVSRRSGHKGWERGSGRVVLSGGGEIGETLCDDADA
jgi:hypothetical protein